MADKKQAAASGDVAESAMGNSAGYVGKMTVGTAGFKKIAMRAASEGKEIVVGDIIGLATEAKATVLDDGSPSIALKGSFETTNADTGEVLQSGICYLPSALSGLIVAVVKELQKENPLPQAFAVRLIAFPASNPIGYSYKATNLAPQHTADPLAGVKAAMKDGGFVALPKPAAQITAQ